MEQKNKKTLAAGLILAGVALIIILGTTMPVAIESADTNSPRIITTRSALGQTSGGSVLLANAIIQNDLDRAGGPTAHCYKHRGHGKWCQGGGGGKKGR